MAVENKYVNTNAAAGKLSNPAFTGSGADLKCVVSTFEVAAADDNGSVYRIFKAVNPELIPVKIEVYNDAITAGTDYDLGFYESNLGAVIDLDALAATMDLSVAHTAADAPLSGLSAVNIDSRQKKIYELAGHTTSTRKSSYDIALTGSTVGTAAGTITVVAWFAQG